MLFRFEMDMDDPRIDAFNIGHAMMAVGKQLQTNPDIREEGNGAVKCEGLGPEGQIALRCEVLDETFDRSRRMTVRAAEQLLDPRTGEFGPPQRVKESNDDR